MNTKLLSNNKINRLVFFGAAAFIVSGFFVANSALAAGPATVNLGASGNFVILSKAGISTTGVTKITGDIGVSPIAATAITGFGLTLDRLGQYSTSPQVTGKIYAADYAVPTPSLLTTAVRDMQTAYTNAAGRAPTSAATTNVGAGILTGLTLVPGVYSWGSTVTIPTDLTLKGSATDVWIFKVAGTLNMAANKNVVLSGGAQAKNVFWQVAGTVTIGAGSHFVGIILAKTNIAMNSGAILNGRTLAQTAVTLIANTVSVSATPSATPNANAITNANTNASFKRDLTVGAVGGDVKALQVWLNTHGYPIASRGPGSSGNETMVFSGLTRAALAKFQAKVGISPALGNFGATTRNYLNTH